MKKRSLAAILAFVMIFFTGYPARAIANNVLEEKTSGPILLLKADAENINRDSKLIRLNLELANSSGKDIPNVSFSLEDPENIILNEEEIVGELGLFFAKTIKDYQFVLRKGDVDKQGTYTLFLHIDSSAGKQRIPLWINLGPEGLIAQIYSPSAKAPNIAEKDSQGTFCFQIANKGNKPVEQLVIRAKSLSPFLTMETEELHFDIRHRQIHFYKDEYDLQEFLKENLIKIIAKSRK